MIATNEVAPGELEFPGSFFEFLSAVLSASTGGNPVYAVKATGTATRPTPTTPTPTSTAGR